MIKLLFRLLYTISIILFSFELYSQKLSEKEFEERLNYERGNYAIHNYDQDFLGRPGFLWSAMKSKTDNLLYMTKA